MRRFPALRGLRIGCVQYLNSKPLIRGYDGAVAFDHPSGLAGDLAAGALDAALVPIFEALRGPRYRVVEGVAIGSDGPVFSVFLAHRGPLAAVRTVALDPASRTSAHLLQVLLAEFHSLHPRCVDARDFPGTPDAELLIGNQAIDFRLADAGRHHLLDLGEEWRRHTGLPFVFAAWLLRPELPDARSIAEAFRHLHHEGMLAIPAIAAAERDPALATRYLTEQIRFDLGEREKAGIARFAGLLAKHALIPRLPAPLEYV